MKNNSLEPALTDEQKGQIYGILSVGCDRETAANFVGCRAADIGRAMQQDRAFAAHVRKTEASCELAHMRKIQKAAEDVKNWRASVWWMERHAPERFGSRGAGEVTVRQLDEFFSCFAELVCDRVENEEDQNRLLEGMDEMIRALDELVRTSDVLTPTKPGQGWPLEPAAESDESIELETRGDEA